MYENNLINKHKLYNVHYTIETNVDSNIIDIIATILIVIDLHIKILIIYF